LRKKDHLWWKCLKQRLSHNMDWHTAHSSLTVTELHIYDSAVLARPTAFNINDVNVRPSVLPRSHVKCFADLKGQPTEVAYNMYRFRIAWMKTVPLAVQAKPLIDMPLSNAGQCRRLGSHRRQVPP
jgi:hypothetical protein